MCRPSVLFVPFWLGILALGFLQSCQIKDEFQKKAYFYEAFVAGDYTKLTNRSKGAQYRNNNEDTGIAGDSVSRYTSYSLLPGNSNADYGIVLSNLRFPVPKGGAIDSATYRALQVGNYGFLREGLDTTAPVAELYYQTDNGTLYSSRYGPQDASSYFQLTEKTFVAGSRTFQSGAEVRISFQAKLYTAQGQRITVTQGTSWGQFK